MIVESDARRERARHEKARDPLTIIVRWSSREKCLAEARRHDEEARQVGEVTRGRKQDHAEGGISRKRRHFIRAAQYVHKGFINFPGEFTPLPVRELLPRAGFPQNESTGL